jgi:hypothetical protein
LAGSRQRRSAVSSDVRVPARRTRRSARGGVASLTRRAAPQELCARRRSLLPLVGSSCGCGGAGGGLKLSAPLHPSERNWQPGGTNPTEQRRSSTLHTATAPQRPAACFRQSHTSTIPTRALLPRPAAPAATHLPPPKDRSPRAARSGLRAPLSNCARARANCTTTADARAAAAAQHIEARHAPMIGAPRGAVAAPGPEHPRM